MSEPAKKNRLRDALWNKDVKRKLRNVLILFVILMLVRMAVQMQNIDDWVTDMRYAQWKSKAPSSLR